MTKPVQSLVFLLLTLVVVPIFYVSIMASVDMSYEVSTFTFGDAFTKATSTPFGDLLRDDYAQPFLYFIPFTLAVCIAFVSLRSARAKNYVLLVAIITPLLFLPFSPLLSPKLPSYLFAPHDGETWGEGWPAISTVGFWIVVLLALAVYRWRYRDEMATLQEEG